MRKYPKTEANVDTEYKDIFKLLLPPSIAGTNCCQLINVGSNNQRLEKHTNDQRLA